MNFNNNIISRIINKSIKLNINYNINQKELCEIRNYILKNNIPLVINIFKQGVKCSISFEEYLGH
jgi:hypothetical protein